MKLARSLLLLLVLVGGGLFVGVSPAAADRVEQHCTTKNQYRICISYNYSTSTVAANVQNQASKSRNTFIGLSRGNYQPWMKKETRVLSPGQWRGIYVGPIAQSHFCASADLASQTVVRYNICHQFT
jgi:hypothetical protein